MQSPIVRPFAPAPGGMHWPVSAPFLFLAHHVDHYPAGTKAMTPAVPLTGRDIGQDFSQRDGWSMYHGDSVPGFPAHPHRGFETITIVRQGIIDHSDSLGATARFGAGDVQWLTAGNGIVHSEMFPLLNQQIPNPAELFQLWLNLPAADKRVPPYFSMFWQEEVPVVERKDARGKRVTVQVVAGAFEKVKPPKPPPSSWASRPEAHVAVWVLTLDPGASIQLPAAHASAHRSLLLIKGESLKVAGQAMRARSGVQVKAEVSVEVENPSNGTALVLMLQGVPINEPVAHYGPFVMNTREELQQAFQDYQTTRFGGWPWKSAGPVHPATEGRFALYPDGRKDKPSKA